MLYSSGEPNENSVYKYRFLFYVHMPWTTGTWSPWYTIFRKWIITSSHWQDWQWWCNQGCRLWAGWGHIQFRVLQTGQVWGQCQAAFQVDGSRELAGGSVFTEEWCGMLTACKLFTEIFSSSERCQSDDLKKSPHANSLCVQPCCN